MVEETEIGTGKFIWLKKWTLEEKIQSNLFSAHQVHGLSIFVQPLDRAS